MLVQDIELQLVGPPFAVGRAATSSVAQRALGFSCHVFSPLIRHFPDEFSPPTTISRFHNVIWPWRFDKTIPGARMAKKYLAKQPWGWRCRQVLIHAGGGSLVITP
jgi:hypothetical protein